MIFLLARFLFVFKDKDNIGSYVMRKESSRAFSFVLELGTELRALGLLGKSSATELNSAESDRPF